MPLTKYLGILGLEYNGYSSDDKSLLHKQVQILNIQL